MLVRLSGMFAVTRDSGKGTDTGTDTGSGHGDKLGWPEGGLERLVDWETWLETSSCMALAAIALSLFSAGGYRCCRHRSWGTRREPGEGSGGDCFGKKTTRTLQLPSPPPPLCYPEHTLWGLFPPFSNATPSIDRASGTTGQRPSARNVPQA